MTKYSADYNYSVSKLINTWTKVPTIRNNRAAFNNEFFNSVITASKELKCDPDDLMTMMYSENGFNYNSRNGLFGFCTDLDGRNMTPAQQVNAAKAYLLKGKKGSFGLSKQLTGGQLYSLNFVPGVVAENQRIAKKNNYNPDALALIDKRTRPNAYASNIGLDYNSDKKITTLEMQHRLNLKRDELERVFDVRY